MAACGVLGLDARWIGGLGAQGPLLWAALLGRMGARAAPPGVALDPATTVAAHAPAALVGAELRAAVGALLAAYSTSGRLSQLLADAVAGVQAAAARGGGAPAVCAAVTAVGDDVRAACAGFLAKAPPFAAGEVLAEVAAAFAAACRPEAQDAASPVLCLLAAVVAAVPARGPPALRARLQDMLGDALAALEDAPSRGAVAPYLLCAAAGLARKLAAIDAAEKTEGGEGGDGGDAADAGGQHEVEDEAAMGRMRLAAALVDVGPASARAARGDVRDLALALEEAIAKGTQLLPGSELGRLVCGRPARRRTEALPAAVTPPAGTRAWAGSDGPPSVDLVATAVLAEAVARDAAGAPASAAVNLCGVAPDRVAAALVAVAERGGLDPAAAAHVTDALLALPLGAAPGGRALRSRGLAVCVGRLLAEVDRLGRGPAEGAGGSSEGLRGPLATLRRVADAARGDEDDLLCSTFLLTSSASVRAAARGDGLAEELRRLGAAAARGLEQWASTNPRLRFVESHLQQAGARS